MELLVRVLNSPEPAPMWACRPTTLPSTKRSCGRMACMTAIMIVSLHM